MHLALGTKTKHTMTTSERYRVCFLNAERYRGAKYLVVYRVWKKKKKRINENVLYLTRRDISSSPLLLCLLEVGESGIPAAGLHIQVQPAVRLSTPSWQAHTYAAATPVMQTGHTQHSSDHKQHQWPPSILLAGWIRMEVFLGQDEGLSVGIRAHLCPTWIPLAAGLRYVVSPGAALVPCPAQLLAPGTQVPTAATQLLEQIPLHAKQVVHAHTHTCRPAVDPTGLRHSVRPLAGLGTSHLQSPHAQTNGSLRWPRSPYSLPRKLHGRSDPSGSYLLLSHAHLYLAASQATWPTFWSAQPDASWWHALTHSPSRAPVVAHRHTTCVSSGPTPAVATRTPLCTEVESHSPMKMVRDGI